MFNKVQKLKITGLLIFLSLMASSAQAAAPMCSQVLGSFSKRAIFETHDNKQMAFKLSGNENAKRVIIFLNGLDKSYNEWNDVRNLVEAQNPDTLFVQLDMLGQGQTAKLTPKTSDLIKVDDQIQMLYEFIKTHGYETRNLIIVGHSYGGGIAGRFIHDHPNMVKRAVLIAPFVDNLETYHGAMGSVLATCKVACDFSGFGFIYQSTLQMGFATGASLSWSSLSARGTVDGQMSDVIALTAGAYNMRMSASVNRPGNTIIDIFRMKHDELIPGAAHENLKSHIPYENRGKMYTIDSTHESVVLEPGKIADAINIVI